ncbi:hypothetical protein BD310DRAFT_1035738 [Dichomitus squalens]|uniref:DUF6593 domain-containing protein n=1 Tax=Dichomitus squalens TaxID=114155 RepID=A0A4V2K9D9_9APHY|nr:hypothetical protein BD310DRAFT_1035738 [Dichomitus squalens]
MCAPDSRQHVISFLEDDPLRSDVVSAASGETLYSITTEAVGLRKDTTILRDAQGNVFAGWEQKSFRRDQVTFHGVRCKLSEWLRKKTILSSTRVLVAPDGEEFHWKEKPTTFELVSTRTRTPIARSHNAHSAVGQLLGLSVAPSAVPMLDAILLSFVILEQRRREELGRASATGGAAYTASGTSAANVSSP